MSEYNLITKGYLSGVVLELLEKKVKFFLNSKLEPMVQIPDDGFQQDWPANSQRLLDLLNAIYYEASLGEILRKNEREFLLSQIREKCRQGDRRFTHYEAEEAEVNPIVQALLCFVNGHERFEGRLADLLGILRDSPFADRYSQREGIPIYTRVFSQRLKRLIPVLRGYGVEVKIEHRESGSHCLISRTESFAIEPEETLDQWNDPVEAQGCVKGASAVSTGNE